MREIPNDLLELISGGKKMHTMVNTATQTVVITGSPPIDPNGPGSGGVQPPGSGGTPGGGGGGSTAHDQWHPHHTKHHTSAKPAHWPDGVNPDDLRNMALEAADTINGMSHKVENAIAIIRDASGNLRLSDVTPGDKTGFHLSVTLNGGDKIVSWIHNHPSERGVDQGFPSTPDNANNPPGDTGIAAQFIASGQADPNMILYIIDDKSGKIFEYVARDPVPDSHGPDITSDENNAPED